MKAFSILAIIIIMANCTAASAQKFNITPQNSEIKFNIRYLILGKINGEFQDFEGSFLIDENISQNNHVETIIKTQSVDTGSKLINQDVRSPDLFDVKTYPVMTFKSDQIDVLDDNTARISGQLTLLKTTKPISLKLVKAPSKDKALGDGFKVTGKLKRTDFEMRTLKPIGDLVNLMICYNTEQCNWDDATERRTQPRYNP